MENYPKKQRLVFIDLMRAYAILMMVQGHLTDACLALEYRNPDYTLYYIWEFMRGLTAPVFFFASGMIFTFLLKKQEKGQTGFKNNRVKKGLKRVVQLLFWGYLLRFNWYLVLDYFNDWKLDYTYSSSIAIDVLHIIGLAIFVIIFLYLIFGKRFYSFVSSLLVFAVLSIIVFPFIQSTDFSDWPNFIANYLTKDNRSVFTLFPWVGYSLTGAVAGAFIFKYEDITRSLKLGVLLVLIGLIIHLFIADFLLIFKNLGSIFESLAYDAYLFERMGQVLIISGMMIFIAKFWKNIPPIIPKIGSETLVIYIVHSFIIYGSIFQYGIAQNYGKSLSPWECFWLALGLELFFVVLTYYIDEIRNGLANIKEKIKATFKAA